LRRMRPMRGHFEIRSGKMIDAVQQTASAGNENAAADVIDEWLFFDRALQSLEDFTQSQVNDRVQRLALDFLSGKTGIVFEHDCFAGQTVSKHAAAFFGL